MSSIYDQQRKAKNEFFADAPDSPLTDEQRANFKGLDYFPVDRSLSFVIEVERIQPPEPVEMATSTGAVAEFERWGLIQFSVKGEEAELTLYARNHELFLPFTDATSGEETYGAGRYVDPERLGQGRVRIDFNTAYNPYCAYNEKWACPVPPAENRLDVAIRAGEKAFK